MADVQKNVFTLHAMCFDNVDLYTENCFVKRATGDIITTLTTMHYA